MRLVGKEQDRSLQVMSWGFFFLWDDKPLPPGSPPAPTRCFLFLCRPPGLCILRRSNRVCDHPPGSGRKPKRQEEPHLQEYRGRGRAQQVAPVGSQLGLSTCGPSARPFPLISVDFRRRGLGVSAKHGELSVAPTPACTRRLRLDEGHFKAEMMKCLALWRLVQRTPQQTWGMAVKT